MRATTIFHPVLLIGTAPNDAVLAVAYACRARAPYRPLTIVVPQARADTMRQAAPPGSTVLGYEGAHFGLDNISVRGLAARLNAAALHQILIAATGHRIADYRYVIRAARHFGGFPRDIRFAQVAADGAVTITPVLRRRLRESVTAVGRLLGGPIGSVVLGVAGAAAGLGLASPLAPWLCLLTAHLLTAVSQRVSWDEYTGDAGIHLQLARRTGSGQPFCYDSGQYSAGSSSPLWTLVLALLWAFGVRHLERAAKITAACAAHLALVAMAVVGYSWLGAGPAWGLAPLLLATLPWFHVWTARAMETSLAVLAGALVCGVALSGAVVPLPLQVTAFAVAFLVRWEHAALLAPMFALSLWRGGVPLLWAPVPMLAVAALNLIRTGSPVASTAGSRRAAAQASRHDASASRWPDAVWDLLLSKPALALAVAAGLVAAAVRPEPGVLAMIASLGMGVLFFTLVVPMTYDERYLMPWMPAYLLLAVSMMDAAPAGTARAAALMLAGGVAVERIAALMSGWPARRRAAARGRLYEREFRARVAADIERRLPPHGILACIEVDLRWFMTRRDTQIVGLDAVLDGTVAPALRAGRFGDLLRRRAVSHVLIEENLHDRAGWRDTDLHPLVGGRQSLEIAGAGRMMPVRAWAYRNWGDGTPVRWVLWELHGDTMALPPIASTHTAGDAVVTPPASSGETDVPVAA